MCNAIIKQECLKADVDTKKRECAVDQTSKISFV